MIPNAGIRPCRNENPAYIRPYTAKIRYRLQCRITASSTTGKYGQFTANAKSSPTIGISFLRLYKRKTMENLYRLPFTIVQCPNLKLKKPSWIRKPSNTVVLFGLLVSYFLVTAGVIYDIIVEPPSVGSTTDEYGHHKPVAFMAWRINGQYIMEGLAASFMFTLGGLGFILLDQTNKPNMPRLNRVLMIICSFIFILVAYCATKIFIRIKMPSYLT
ncbi:unnamed protein product [Rotaria socialis]|uniref:Oligosaccharyltransferase complex subunit n=2 Tax=Rotaria socialis TaxID=392032 RepID=A0A818QHL4_9BILA|nr:unnamed protein product [Rotaria socialis]